MRRDDGGGMERTARWLWWSWLVAGAAAAGADEAPCERVTVAACRDLGYNWTVMPNLMGNRDQREAERAMSEYGPLLESACSPHARLLLCSAFAPLCSEHVPAVAACRALCRAVSAACAGPLSALAPRARALLHCDRFPDLEDRRLCMRPPSAADAAPAPSPPPRRWPFDDDLDSDAPPAVPCGPNGAPAPDGSCAPACPASPSTRADGPSDAAGAALTCLALLFTTVAVLTYCADPSRFRYPERPVVLVAACHAVRAAALLARAWWPGARRAACAGDAADGGPCVAFFAVTYYCTLAADAWFLNACVAWYLTAASEWSTEALERAAAYLHGAAWGWAAGWTAAALALRGACGAAGEPGGVARGAALAAAAALAGAAVPAVCRLRRALDVRGARRVGRLAARAAGAGLAYWACSAAETVLGASGGAAGGLVAGAAGVAASGWAWSYKSARVWRRTLCPPLKSAPAQAPAPTLVPAYAHLPPAPSYCKRPHVSRV